MSSRRALSWLAGIGGCLAAGLVIGAYALLAKPEWLLNSHTAARGLAYFADSYQPTWKELFFKVQSRSLWEKEIHIRASGVCFKSARHGASGCVKNLDAQLTIELYLFGLQVTRLSRLFVDGDRLYIIQRKGAQPQTALDGRTYSSQAGSYPDTLRGMSIGNMDVTLPSIEIVESESKIRGSLHLRTQTLKPSQLILDALFDSTPMGSKRATQHYSANLSIESDLFSSGRLGYADVMGQLEMEGVKARLSARADRNGVDAFSLKIKADALQGSTQLRLRSGGRLTRQNLVLTGDAGVWLLASPLRNILFDRFTLVVSPGHFRHPELITFSSNFEAEPAPYKHIKRLRLPSTISGVLKLQANIENKLDSVDYFNADIAIALKPYKNWYELNGGLKAKVSGRISRPQTLRIAHGTDISLQVPKFEDLVAFLSGTTYSIPAPLDSLKGPLTVVIGSSGDPRRDRHELTYHLQSLLQGEQQKLVLSATGKLLATRILSTDRFIKSYNEVLFEDVSLQAPHLDIKAMPALTLDSRIKNLRQIEKERKSEALTRKRALAAYKPSFSMDIHAVTAKPAVVQSNLANGPVPISLDLRVQNPSGGFSGTVELGAFPVNFFRRAAMVDHIRFVRLPGSKITDVEGLIVYKVDEAVIRISLLGNTDKPRVVFESDPPMSQQEIIAMLLYGKSPTSLDSDQTSTVANTQTALSEKAFGLASLYLFASTPIEYVGYDPISRSYNMKFRLPGGATLQLGSDFTESRMLQLRKRLSTHFAIQTEVTNVQDQGNSLTTFLEWFIRR